MPYIPYMPYKPYKPYTNTGIKKDTREERGGSVEGWVLKKIPKN